MVFIIQRAQSSTNCQMRSVSATLRLCSGEPANGEPQRQKSFENFVMQFSSQNLQNFVLWNFATAHFLGYLRWPHNHDCFFQPLISRILTNRNPLRVFLDFVEGPCDYRLHPTDRDLSYAEKSWDKRIKRAGVSIASAKSRLGKAFAKALINGKAGKVRLKEEGGKVKRNKGAAIYIRL